MFILCKSVQRTIEPSRLKISHRIKHADMKSFITFLRTTIAGGILFLIPIIVIITVVKKAFDILETVTAPLADRLEDDMIFGLDGHNLIAIGSLLVICFLAGLILKLNAVQNSVSNIEKKILIYIPGYMLIKSLAAEYLRQQNEDTFIPVLVRSEGTFKPGFLVEQQGDLCTVFIPEPPSISSGDVSIIPASAIIRLSISGNKMRKILASFGKGVTAFIPEDIKQSISTT